ncbi:MAG: response regulator [Streptosporangiales bacterium]|nr:response regulator [Streptosporangiales bacterium]
MLDVLVVDDEPPALAELRYLLEREPGIGAVRTAESADEALRLLDRRRVDALFLDIHMPGLSGLELARILGRFRAPPAVVFVTAYEEHAVDAFELNAVDYLLKPIRAERLSEAVRRVAQPGTGYGEPTTHEETVPVELAGVTRFVPVSDVRYVEAHGDYARLHTSAGSPLVRVPLSTLEERWRRLGFVRIHRSILVSVGHIDEIRFDSGRAVVVVADTPLQVSRRHTRELRELLRRRANGGVA